MKKRVREELASLKQRQAEIRDKVRDANGNLLSSETTPQGVGLETGVGRARETSSGVEMAELGGVPGLAGSGA